MNVATLLAGHGHWRWLLLAIVAVAFLRMAIGAATGGTWQAREGHMMLVARISTYVQLLMGFALVAMLGSNLNHAALGPHMLAAIAGIAALEIGAARSKRTEGDALKFKIAAIGSGVALALFSLATYLNS